MIADPRRAGELQAIKRAGSWPASATIEVYQDATERAVRAAHRAVNLEYRWNMRFRLWERPDDLHDDLHVERQAARLTARKRLAIRIAEEREWVLNRLCAPSRGLA